VAKLLRACVMGVFFFRSETGAFGRTLDVTEEHSLKVKILPVLRKKSDCNFTGSFLLRYVNEISFMWKKNQTNRHKKGAIPLGSNDIDTAAKMKASGIQMAQGCQITMVSLPVTSPRYPLACPPGSNGPGCRLVRSLAIRV